MSVLNKLNQKSEAIFKALIAEAQETGNAKIDNGGAGTMAVCIEKIDTYAGGVIPSFCGNVWSIAHYYEQNGDLCNDPEMTFLETGNGIYPLSFEMQGNVFARHEVSLDIYKESPTIKSRLQRDHATFANQWMLNIKQQQGVKVGGKEPQKAPAILELPTSTTTPTKADGLELVEYSPLSIAVFGEKTKQYKDELFKLGGKFNRFLKRDGVQQAGWIFSKKKEQDLRNYFSF